MSKYTVSPPLIKNNSLFDESLMRILYPSKTRSTLYWINGLLVIPSANYVDISCLYTCLREIYVYLLLTYVRVHFLNWVGKTAKEAEYGRVSRQQMHLGRLSTDDKYRVCFLWMWSQHEHRFMNSNHPTREWAKWVSEPMNKASEQSEWAKWA